MSSLKEIRGRINSISTTLKITDVTRMIAGAKLHKTQATLSKFKAYEEKIEGIFNGFAASESGFVSPYSLKRKEKRVALVVMSSNSSLCGAFNANIIKSVKTILSKYDSFEPHQISVHALGKKVFEALSTAGYQLHYTLEGPHTEWIDAPSYDDISSLAELLMKQYVAGEIDTLIMIGSRSKNVLTQVARDFVLLPFTPETVAMAKGSTSTSKNTDYIVEPSKSELLTALVPQIIKLRMFQLLLETKVAEFAARSASMQTATDNANKLIGELTKQYNRLRQAAITREIIDIIGGSEALQ